MKAMASSPDSKSATPPPDRRRRTRSSCSSSVSSSSSSSIRSTPSPSHYFIQTPFHSSSSSIPFSWELTPGIPKNPSKTLKPRPSPHLPLPPPLRPDSFGTGGKKKLDAGESLAEVDPFAAAMAECAKDPPPEADSDPWIGSRPVSEAKGRRRFSIGDRFGLSRLDLYGSCKTSCSVAHSTIEIPQVSQQRFGYRVLNRRVG